MSDEHTAGPPANAPSRAKRLRMDVILIAEEMYRDYTVPGRAVFFAIASATT